MPRIALGWGSMIGTFFENFIIRCNYELISFFIRPGILHRVDHRSGRQSASKVAVISTNTNRIKSPRILPDLSAYEDARPPLSREGKTERWASLGPCHHTSWRRRNAVSRGIPMGAIGAVGAPLPRSLDRGASAMFIAAVSYLSVSFYL